jgi:hypothetical protein
MPHHKGLAATTLLLTDLRYAATANRLADRCNAQRDQAIVPGRVFFLILHLFYCHRVHWMHTFRGTGRHHVEAKGGEGTVCSCKLLLPAERTESEGTGKVGLFINVQFACYAIHHKPAEHDFSALLAIAAAEKSAGLDVPAVSWQNASSVCPKDVLFEDEYFPWLQLHAYRCSADARHMCYMT